MIRWSNFVLEVDCFTGISLRVQLPKHVSIRLNSRQVIIFLYIISLNYLICLYSLNILFATLPANGT